MTLMEAVVVAVGDDFGHGASRCFVIGWSGDIALRNLESIKDILS